MAFGKMSLLVLLVVFLLSHHLGCEASQAQLRANVWSELDVPDISAQDVWAVLSSPDFPKLIVKLMPNYIKSINYILGDGHVGTILNVTLQPTNPGPLTWHEQFIEINNITRTKAVRQINGGFLNMGFTLKEDIFEIKSTGRNSCVFRSTVNFIILPGFESGASYITADWSFAYAITDYIRANRANSYLASKTDSQ